jgi:hypothetical protein
LAKLAQTSVRFERLEMTERRFKSLGPEVDEAAARIARDIYGDHVSLDVVLEGGSLFARLTAIGFLLLGTYHSVAEYKDFRESLALLENQAKDFSEHVYEKLRELTGGRKADKVVTRTMTPGRISRVINKLEALERATLITREVRQHQFEKIRHEINLIERDLTPKELQTFEQALKSSGLHFPEPIAPEGREREVVAIREEQVPSRSEGPKRKAKPRFTYHNNFAVASRRPTVSRRLSDGLAKEDK